MNFTSIKYILFLPMFITGILFSACDEIGENERMVEVDQSSITKTVLLEDFTGVNCINCPDAHKAAQKSKTIIGDNLVIVSIHAGSFATTRFKTEAGNAYQEYFYSNDAGGYPVGMISRCKFGGSVISPNFLLWNSYILQRLSNPYSMDVNIELKANYSTNNNSFTVESAITPQSKISDVKLQLWITESHIIASQKSTEGTISNYEHNHVLRGAINGIWGEDIDDNIESGSTKTYTTATYYLADKSWVPENLSIVGFLYDAKTMEVLDVKEIYLID